MAQASPVMFTESAGTTDMAATDARTAIAIVADEREATTEGSIAVQLCADGEEITGFGQVKLQIKSGIFAETEAWDATTHITVAGAGETADSANLYTLNAPTIYADAESEGSICTASFNLAAESVVSAKQRGGQLLVTATAETYLADGTMEVTVAEPEIFHFARHEVAIKAGGALAVPAGASALAIPIEGTTADLEVSLNDETLTVAGSTDNSVTILLPANLAPGSHVLMLSHADGGWDAAELQVIQVANEGRMFLPLIR